jgi:two-component system, OmpR family, sensor histidine kinase MprB
MKFRTRVVVAAVLSASLVAVLASIAAFYTTENSTLTSVDASLRNSALSSVRGEDQIQNPPYEIVTPTGEVFPQGRFPADKVLIQIAKGQRPSQFRTITRHGHHFREYIVQRLVKYESVCPFEQCSSEGQSAFVYMEPIDAQITTNGRVLPSILAIMVAGLLLALGLGLWLARRAVLPLEAVTDEIERIANSHNLESRLTEGGNDELGRLRKTFNLLLGNVENSQQLQRQLVLDASHELRTPLTSLRTNAQVLSKASQLSQEDLDQLTTDVVTQVDELSALVGDLAELARGDHSEGEVLPIALDEVVDECLDTARTYARIKNITINSDVTNSVVIGRRDRLMRAVSNLLTNAIKFTPENGQIRVSSAKGVVTVSDSGPGIAAEDRAFVFDRFWRSPSARALPGSGLGLSIVQQVVTEFNGQVSVESDPDLGGARMVMTLPTVTTYN